MNILRHATGWLFVTTALFVGCNDATSGSEENSVVPPASELLYDLPSSMVGGNGSALRLAAADSESIWDVYKPIPAYIGFAQAAKDSVVAFVTRLQAYDLPANFEMEEDGLLLESHTIDTTIAGAAQQFFTIRASKDGKTLLFVNYWKNARDEYRGNFYFYAVEGPDSGNAVYVHYNGHNQASLGQRMLVLAAVPASRLTGDKSGDPALVRVSAVKKGNKVFVGGASWHPNFSDPDGFWSDGAKIYAFQAAANLSTDVTVLRASFAPDSVNRSTLFTDYTLDKQVMARMAVVFQNYLSQDTAVAKLMLWSMETGNPINSLNASNYGDFLAWQPTRTVESITRADLEAFLQINQEYILASDDEDLKTLLAFSSLKQPIFLLSGAAIQGADPESSYGIDSTDLAADEVPAVDPADVQITADDIVVGEDLGGED